MQRKFIPVEESFTRWEKESGYAAAYASLEEEFELAASSIEPHGDACDDASSRNANIIARKR